LKLVVRLSLLLLAEGILLQFFVPLLTLLSYKSRSLIGLQKKKKKKEGKLVAFSHLWVV
jgi:hypothetical protein